MKTIKVTYNSNLLPFIQASPGSLWLNTHYCRGLSPEFLKGVLIEHGNDNVSDDTVSLIIDYSSIITKDTSLSFRLEE
jgi:hypothetical protein